MDISKHREQDQAIHRKLAGDLFNATWELMDKPDRTPAEEALMIHAAHASRYHWEVVGKPENFARGDWQISRVYSVAGVAERALHYALSSLQICCETDLDGFDMGFAHEAVARAYALQGDEGHRDEHLALGTQAAQRVPNPLDKAWLLKNLESVKSLSIPPWE